MEYKVEVTLKSYFRSSLRYVLRACEKKKENVHSVGQPLARRPAGCCWRHHAAGGWIGPTCLQEDTTQEAFASKESRKIEIPKGESVS